MNKSISSNYEKSVNDFQNSIQARRINRGISYKDMAKSMNITEKHVKVLFSSSDLLISEMYRMANAIGFELEINFISSLKETKLLIR